MRIITWRALKVFGQRFPAAAAPLREWYRITSHARWRSFTDIRSTFGQTDLAKVGSGQTVCVFDIGGNKFRLVAFVSYAKSKVYGLRVMTQKEYDGRNQRWKQEL